MYFEIVNHSVHEQEFMEPTKVEMQNGPLPNGQTFVLKVLDPTNNDCSGEQVSCISTYVAACGTIWLGLTIGLFVAYSMFYGWALYVICLVLLIIILLALYIRYQSSHGGILNLKVETNGSEMYIRNKHKLLNH
eukprot:436784_1